MDLLLTETGTGGEKETRNDMVIAVEIPGRGTADFRLARTINLEMQGNTRKSKLGYDIKQRAIYYAASLLRGTVARGDRTYKGIHKVYSVWLCDDKISIEKWEDGEPHIHKIGLRVFQDRKDTSEKTRYDADCDLMEVILIELQHLNKTPEEKALYTLFYGNPRQAIEHVEKLIPVKLERAGKEIYMATNWEELTRQVVEEVREEVTREVTREVTEEVSREVTKEVTREVTRETKEQTAFQALDVMIDMMGLKDTAKIIEAANKISLSENQINKYLASRELNA